MIKELSKKIKNILLIRTDRIGDVVLTLPLVDILKKNFTGANIDFLVNKKVSELVSDYPNINKVHSIEKERLRDILRICKEGNYDLAIAVHPLFSIALCMYLASIRYRLGSGYRWYSFLFNLRHYQHRKNSVKHELEYNIDLLEELGINANGYPAPKLKVSEETIKALKQKLVRKGIDPNKNFIVIHPGAPGSALAWRKENFAELIRLLSSDKEFNYNIIVTEKETEYTLKELTALISLARMFISNSTGPIHIAAAVGTFAVGIYSPVQAQSPVRWAPYTDEKKIFVGGQGIPPPGARGQNDKRNVTLKEHSVTMDSIKAEEVYHFIKSYFLELYPHKKR